MPYAESAGIAIVDFPLYSKSLLLVASHILFYRRRTGASTNGEPASVTEQRKAHGGEDGGEEGEQACHCLCVD